MPTYAVRADAIAYIEGLVVTDNDQLDRLIERAERAIDRALNVNYRAAGAAGVKVPDLTKLNARQREGLMRATCAQVEAAVAWLDSSAGTADPSLNIPAGATRVKGPDFEIQFPLDTGFGGGGASLSIDLDLAPRAAEELAAVGLLLTAVPAF